MPTKVLHLSSVRWNSAITEYCLSMVRSFSQLGYQNHVVTLSGSLAEKRFIAEDIPCEGMTGFGLGSAKKLRGIVGREQPSLVITYSGSETILTKVLKGIPVIRFRGHATPQDDFLFGMKQKYALSHVSRTIVPSEKIQKELMSYQLKHPVDHVHLGCDSKKFVYVESKPEKVFITIVGRFDPVKGHSHAMRLFKLMKDRWQSNGRLVLRIVGMEANLSVANLKSFADRSGLNFDQDVELIDRKVENLSELMSESTVGWIPSIGSEVICRVAEEFLLCGCPILVSKVGTLPEIVGEYSSFGLVAEGDIASVDALLKLAESSFGESADDKKSRAKAAVQVFSYEAMAKSLEPLIADLIKR